MTSQDQCREAFEEWAASLLLPMGMSHPWLERNSNGEYVFGQAPAWWEAWQAARPAPSAPVELPEPFGYWHQGVTDEESDFFLHEGAGDVSCETCAKLYTEQQVRELLSHRDVRTEPGHPQTRMDAQPEAVTEMPPAGWVPVPVEPTREMLDTVVTSMDDFLLGPAAEKQYREDWAAMLAAAPKLPMGNGWIPVGERLPASGELVLVRMIDLVPFVEYELVYHLAHKSGSEWAKQKRGSFTGVALASETVTHWMPLPQPPQEQGS